MFYPIRPKESVRIPKYYHIYVIDYGPNVITADNFENHDGTLCFFLEHKLVFASPMVRTVISKIETI